MYRGAGKPALGTDRITWRIAAPEGQERETSAVISQQEEAGHPRRLAAIFLDPVTC